MSVKIIKPPQRANSHPDGFNCDFQIFLAGSIEMGNADMWQSKVEKAFKDMYHESKDRVVIFNPRRDDWDSSIIQDITDPRFYQQVNWELDALNICDVIALYFDPATKSPISLLELGLFAKKGKVIVYCPDGFWRKGNVQIVCERYNLCLHDDYDIWLDHILNLNFKNFKK